MWKPVEFEDIKENDVFRFWHIFANPSPEYKALERTVSGRLVALFKKNAENVALLNGTAGLYERWEDQCD
jgi:hypothetical protein